MTFIGVEDVDGQQVAIFEAGRTRITILWDKNTMGPEELARLQAQATQEGMLRRVVEAAQELFEATPAQLAIWRSDGTVESKLGDALR